MTDSTNGIVYILENPAMPGLIKIGVTYSESELATRLRTLFNTSVPFPFTCVAAYEVSEYKKVEKVIHEAFIVHRSNPNREFFAMEPHRVRVILKHFGIREVTPGIVQAESKADTEAMKEVIEATERKSNFTFSAVNIPAETTLYFVEDPSVTCVVANDRQVLFQGEITSLSKAALEALAARGKKWPAVSGPKMWLYDDETLSERRTRYDASQQV